MKKGFIKSLLVGLGILCSSLTMAAEYPVKPITMIVAWGAGGGTDATARLVASLLEKELGKPVNVINKTGGNGVVGHTAMMRAKPDGYTIGMLTVEAMMMKNLGLANITASDFTPLALLNVDYPGIAVRSDSPINDLKSLLDDIRKHPGKNKVSGTGQGGIWHVAFVGLLHSEGIDPSAAPFVPSNGAAPAMLELAAGGVQIVPVSLAESKSMVDAGKAKILSFLGPERSPMYPNVPTLKETTGNDWRLSVIRGIVAPKGIPDDVKNKLEMALHKISQSPEFLEFMKSRGFGVVYKNSQDFGAYMAEIEEQSGTVLKEIGMVK